MSPFDPPLDFASSLDIIFEDSHCLAVNKPAGLPTQAAPGFPSLELQAKAYLKRKCGKPGNVYLGVPHRLDRPVSGVVLFARNSKSARRLAEQFHDRTTTKIYWGVIAGQLEPGEATWEDWVRKVPDHARAEIVAPGGEGAKLAKLTVRPIRSLTGATLAEFCLETGRMHQIRIQAGSRGHAILGDELYGSTVPFGPSAVDPRMRPIALHAHSLTLLHPLSYEPMTLTAPLSAYWRQVVGDVH